MSLHFQWILSCPDNSTSFTLTKDPANWADCSYRLERHPVYKGIFNQFTSSLKFHDEGGGKQFVDGIYQAYDIDGNINIQVNIDRDGTGNIYDPLFTGKLNLASYTTDGTYTTVNVEASDIITKLNTRADIPVPVNVLFIDAGYYNDSGTWIPYTFQGVQLAVAQPSDTGLISFNTIELQSGNAYYAQTLDANSNPLTAKFFYTGTDGAGATQSGANALSLTLSVTGGELSVTFVGSLTSPIIIYQQGKQLSLGQQNISPVQAKNIAMPGIPLEYESTFTFTPLAQSGQVKFDGSTGGNHPTYTFPAAPNTCLLSVTTQDANGYLIYDQVNYNSANGYPQVGPGMTSSDGLTTINMTVKDDHTVTVNFASAYGPIDLWQGSLGNLTNSSSPDSGTPPGSPLDTLVPVNDTLTLPILLNPNQDPNNPLWANSYAGYICFDATPTFDNLNDFVGWTNKSKIYGSHSDIPGLLSVADAPPICTGISAEYLQYPVTVEYAIDIEGTITERIYNISGINEPGMFSTVAFVLAWGGGQAAGTTTPLSIAECVTLNSYVIPPFNTPGGGGEKTMQFGNSANGYQLSFTGNGAFTLQPGDQVWLFAVTTQRWPVQGNGHPDEPKLSIYLDFTFTSSKIEFKVIETTPPTVAETIMVHEAFNQVVDMIADSDGNFCSEFYGRTNSQKKTYKQNGEGSLRTLTNGLCIRGHLDKPIMLSLNDTFNSLNAIDNIGLTVDANNKVRVEKLEYFFNPDANIANLPYVNTYETTNCKLSA